MNGNPLMPTHPAKARKLLKKGRAKVVHVKPFTIQLNYTTNSYVQDLALGIDSGYLNIGFSVISTNKEIMSGEVKLLQGIKERLEERRSYRKNKRKRLRHRKPRFKNRKTIKGWLAPSLRHKLESHKRFIEKIKRLLPINNITIEVGSFDIQKINNPTISGIEYQQGDQMGFWNIREYIFHRDNHQCQNPNCNNKSINPILQVHHIIFKSNGGTDMPSNLVTLCNKCHTTSNHKKGKFLYEWQFNKPKIRSFKEATFMTTVRWRLAKLEGANITYGHITKLKRITKGLEKSHYNDAFIIAGGLDHKRCERIQYRQVRRNNRSLEKFYDAKFIDIRTGKKVSASELNCGRTTRNKNENKDNLRKYRGTKISKGQRRIRKQRHFYQPNDLVRYEGQICRVIGTISNGKGVKLDINKYPTPKKLTPYKFSKGLVAI